MAALLEKLTADEATVTLVNLNQLQPRTVIIQGGAYGEHEIVTVKVGDNESAAGSAAVRITLEPGAGSPLTLRLRRHAKQPTLAMPW